MSSVIETVWCTEMWGTINSPKYDIFLKCGRLLSLNLLLRPRFKNDCFLHYHISMSDTTFLIIWPRLIRVNTGLHFLNWNLNWQFQNSLYRRLWTTVRKCFSVSLTCSLQLVFTWYKFVKWIFQRGNVAAHSPVCFICLQDNYCHAETSWIKYAWDAACKSFKPSTVCDMYVKLKLQSQTSLHREILSRWRIKNFHEKFSGYVTSQAVIRKCSSQLLTEKKHSSHGNKWKLLITLKWSPWFWLLHSVILMLYTWKTCKKNNYQRADLSLWAVDKPPEFSLFTGTWI